MEKERKNEERKKERRKERSKRLWRKRSREDVFFLFDIVLLPALPT